MKTLALAVLMLSTLSFARSTGTFTTFTYTMPDGTVRTYATYSPKLQCNALITFLHGTLVDAQFNSQPYALKTQWEAIADGATGMIPCILWPLAMENLATGTHYWSADGACVTFGATCPDDIDFIADVIQAVQGQYGILPGQTFVAGMSSGGFATQMIGDHYSCLVAAIAPVSGGQYIGTANYQWQSPVLQCPGLSVYRPNGTVDNVVPGCGTAKKSWWGNVSGSLQPMDALDINANHLGEMGYWAGQNQCQTFTTTFADGTTTTSPQTMCTNGQPTSGVVELDATDCLGGSEMDFIWEPGVGHAWVAGTELKIWAFFQSHARTQ